MDIDRIVRRASERLAARPSRRGFVSAGAKLATVAATVVAGLRSPRQAAAQALADTCCTGSYECGTNGKCPSGTKKRYQWFCNYEGERHLCVDCFDSEGYECTAVRR